MSCKLGREKVNGLRVEEGPWRYGVDATAEREFIVGHSVVQVERILAPWAAEMRI